jgi:hypothetical protein
MYEAEPLYIDADKPNPLRKRYKKEVAAAQKEHIHIYGPGCVCETDVLGHPTPNNRSPLDLVVDATEGFIPLWDQGVTLRWRFNEFSMQVFRDPNAAKAYIRELFARGVALWGDASPVRFTEVQDAWDFEIKMEPQANCTINGCTLARAFFPGGGQNDLALYPTLFDQTVQEQIETMAHEVGHIYGLRHFFANVSETAWASEIFGTHNQFSIMNYGHNSFMTDDDRNDLKSLYSSVWDGSLTNINGTPVQLFKPFSHNRFLTLPRQIAAAVQMR